MRFVDKVVLVNRSGVRDVASFLDLPFTGGSASSQAGFITGTTIPIDDGFAIGKRP